MSIDIFKKIPQSEKRVLVKELVRDKEFITVKGVEDYMMNYLAVGVENEFILITGADTEGKTIQTPQKVLVNFTKGEDKYYLQTTIVAKGNFFSFDFAADMYILQRRKAARVEMPKEYKAQFNIVHMRNQAVLFESRVLDYGSGGIKANFPMAQPSFVVGEVYKGVLHLGLRRPIELDTEVRHVQVITDAGLTNQILGLKFINLNSIMENKMMTITMDLHREFFVRMVKD